MVFVVYKNHTVSENPWGEGEELEGCNEGET